MTVSRGTLSSLTDLCLCWCRQTKEYCSWSEFHSDMLLVRDNCRLYNAPGTQVRQDCDVVFKFYLDESQKVSGSLPQVCLLIG